MSFKVGLFLCCSVLSVATVQAGIVGRIVGGANVENWAFPFQVSLQMEDIHICGGSVISEKYILTAAHCVVYDGTDVDPIPAELFSIRAGSNNQLHGGVVVKVRAITIHNNYEHHILSDIAVLELVKSLTFSSKIQPIPLATEEVPNGSNVIISGWGHQENGSEKLSDQLKFTAVQAISAAKCYLRIGIFSEEILCLEHKVHNGLCKGDSGGPAVYNNKLVGVSGFIVSTCGAALPDGYAKVSFHAEWIKSIIDRT